MPAPSTSTSATTTIAAKTSTWKTLAHDGEFDKAYVALKAEGGAAAVHDEAAELLLAADVARLSHHPADAVVHLRKVVSNHAGDPRAPLAAFTLGRVLLEELGQPGQAAEAFAKARALGGAGTLAEDALAREVEAWWRAGATDKAHARAEEYVKLYPQGIRIRSVKKYGGIEE
jgi:transmembrane sensor